MTFLFIALCMVAVTSGIAYLYSIEESADWAGQKKIQKSQKMKDTFQVSLFLTSVIFVFCGFGPMTAKYYKEREIVKTKAEIEFINKNTVGVEKAILKELDKYPEIEREILGNISPEILLSYPILRSNETIMAAAEKIDEYAKLRAEYELELIGHQNDLTKFERNPLVIQFFI